MDESSQTGAPTRASEQTSGSSSVSRQADEATGRPSAEALCRRVISILDAQHNDRVTVGLLRELFDAWPVTSQPVVKRPWPPLRAADPYDPRD
ncbi:hypothetical protein GCM10010522_39000 [Kribbella solani]|uniref:Uncharacterized protein n=1 Tax=Kribbella solani TaxID=236067 RepID=A0A841DUY8_9ACTN|nr:hypothetical protein [Kribbella solani]